VQFYVFLPFGAVFYRWPTQHGKPSSFLAPTNNQSYNCDPMAIYFVTFTPKCFVLAVAAVSDEPRAILLNKICKILQLLHCFVNSVHDG